MRELTEKERQVLRLLVLTGKKTESMAQNLGITERTIKYHIANILDAFEVESRIHLQAEVLRRVIGRLAELEGVRWPRADKSQTVAASEFLGALFDGSSDPVANAFLEPLKRSDLKEKAPSKAKSKHRPRGPYDWSKVDWNEPKAKIASDLGCSRAMVYRKYNQLQEEGRI